MIRFPRALQQQIHKFEKDGSWYVANPQVGELLQIDTLTAEILELCGTSDNAGILEKLGDRYREGQILESLKNLSGDLESQLFVPQTKPTLSSTAAKEKLRIFIPHGFMKYQETLSPNTNVEIYNLLIALAKYAEVFVEIDNADIAIKQREHLMALGIQFISDIFESTDQPTHASNRFILPDCHGILALSPHPYEELNYFRHNTIPVVSRIYSDRDLHEATFNRVLSHQALQRNFDQICPDSPWIADELALSHSFPQEALCTIPNGVDTQMYSPKDRQEAREAVASIVEDQSIRNTPVVGILNGFQPQNSIKMIGELANLHKDVVFIVLDSILSRQKSLQHRNVFYIDLQRPEDTVALPWIYNACEFIIFPTVIGTPFSMMLEALACGVPGLALISASLPEDLGRCIKSLPITRYTTIGKFAIPTMTLSKQIDKLLGASEMRTTLSTNAREVALNYSWDRTARCFVELFTALNEKVTENGKSDHSPIAFSQYYDKAQNVVRIGATQLDGFFKQPVEEGLTQTLLLDHTPGEVRTVLQYLLQDPDKADGLLATLMYY